MVLGPLRARLLRILCQSVHLVTVLDLDFMRAAEVPQVHPPLEESLYVADGR